MLDFYMATQKIQLEAAWKPEHGLISSKYIGEFRGNMSLWKVLEGLRGDFCSRIGQKKKKKQTKTQKGKLVIGGNEWNVKDFS